MSIPIPKSSGGNFTPVAAGTYVARCFKMVHIGTVYEEIKGKKELLNKIWISWELPTELKEFKDGEGLKPYVISKEYTLSLNEKSNLRKMLEAWRGEKFTQAQMEDFDVAKLLGVPCQLSVSHKTAGNGNVYAEISAVTPLMKGITVPPQVNPTFELNYENFDFEKFKSQPDFIRKKMEASIEFAAVENNEQMGELEKRNQQPGVDPLPF